MCSRRSFFRPTLSKRQSMLNPKGFTLIEVLIAAVIISVLMISLSLALQAGLAGHARNERFLIDERARDIFVAELTGELPNAIPLSLRPFEGDSAEVRFPARLRHYTGKGPREGVYEVEYKCFRGSLVRTERPLKHESLRQSDREEKEI